MDLDNAEFAVECLVKNGARIDDKDYKEQTALFRAVYYKNEKMVACLLSLGANPNTQEKHFGFTCLGAAIFKQYFSIARMLLEAGADIKSTRDCLRNIDPVFQYNFEADEIAKALFEYYEVKREKKRQFEARKREIERAVILAEILRANKEEIKSKGEASQIGPEAFLLSQMLSAQAEEIIQEFI
jgi:Ankyrin repeats (3 copies)